MRVRRGQVVQEPCKNTVPNGVLSSPRGPSETRFRPRVTTPDHALRTIHTREVTGSIPVTPIRPLEIGFGCAEAMMTSRG
jgi:hypothetical protein